MGRIEELLKREAEWLDKENPQGESRWLKEGIEIYKELVSLDRDNIVYRKRLVHYMFRRGYDLKLLHENYREAKKVFEKLRKLKPEDGEVLYHLGYIEFMDEYYDEALDLLGKSIETNDLTLEQRINALLAVAVCKHKQFQTEEADDFFEKAKILRGQLDEPQSMSTAFQFAKKALAESSGESQPFLLEIKDTIRMIGYEECDDLLFGTEAGKYVLDLRGLGGITLYGGGIRIRFEMREAELLRELMLSRFVKSAEELKEAIWGERGNPTIVKRFIGSLRKKMADGGLPSHELITHISRTGYKWNSEAPTYVISLRKPHF